MLSNHSKSRCSGFSLPSYWESWLKHRDGEYVHSTMCSVFIITTGIAISSKNLPKNAEHLAPTMNTLSARKINVPNIVKVLCGKAVTHFWYTNYFRLQSSSYIKYVLCGKAIRYINYNFALQSSCLRNEQLYKYPNTLSLGTGLDYWHAIHNTL